MLLLLVSQSWIFVSPDHIVPEIYRLLQILCSKIMHDYLAVESLALRLLF